MSSPRPRATRVSAADVAGDEEHTNASDALDGDGDTTNRDSDAISPADIAEEFYRIALSLRHSARHCMEPEGDASLRPLSLPRMRLLHVIAESGAQPLRMRDLSVALGVTARNVTTIVDGLERDGFLVRRPDATDRRAILLELTEFGRAHIARMYELQIRMSERLFAPLDTDERRVFMRLLGKISAGAEAFPPVELSHHALVRDGDTGTDQRRGRGRRYAPAEGQ